MRTAIRTVAIALLQCLAIVSHTQTHPFTVADDIEMTRFGDPLAGVTGETAKVSPDGEHIAIVTSKGIIKTNQIQSTIFVFDTASLEAFLQIPGHSHPPRPKPIVTFRAVQSRVMVYAYAPIITDLHWSGDSRSMYFIAEDVTSEYRLYVANLNDRRAKPLSPKGWNVMQFGMAQQTIVFTAWRAGVNATGLDRSQGFSVNADAQDITGLSLRDILFYNPSRDRSAHAADVFEINLEPARYMLRHVLTIPSSDYPYLLSPLEEPISLSPQGHMLITLMPLATVSPTWSAYEPAIGYEHMRIRPDDPGTVSPDNLGRPRQFALINLQTRTLVPLVHAPNGLALGYADGQEVVWSHDETQVLLTNTFLPLEGVDASEHKRRYEPCAVAHVQLSLLSLGCVMFSPDGRSGGTRERHSLTASFGSDDQHVFIRISSQGHEEIKDFTRHGAVWEPSDVRAESTQTERVNTNTTRRRDIVVAVKQDLNHPPRLWVTDIMNGQSKELWDPNPQFRAIDFGETSVYLWRDTTGHEWKGGLVKPVGYVAGKRYPLVLQIYGFPDQLFMTDGMMPTAFAARHLASVGIMVLQIQKDVHTLDDEEEQHHLRALTSAADQLIKDGLADPAKVGIVGFSISDQYIENALIKEPRRFAAATIAEGTDHSYMQYHLWDDTSLVLRQQDERIIGSRGFGDGLKRWFEEAPGFHLDAVQTPLRIEAMDPWNILGEWEIYSSLRMQGKPVDFVYFPKGQHIHQTPLERMASQQGDVDWFRFWLQDYEDPDPSKGSQYKLWEKLRRLQETAVAGVRLNHTLDLP